MSKPAPVTSAGVPFETTVHVRDHCLCLAAQRAARTLARRFDEALRPAGLTSGQFSLLMSLNQPRPPSIGAVAGLLAMDRTTLTANLKPLERRGLATTTIDPDDRRGRLVSLTRAGRTVLRAACRSGGAPTRRSTGCCRRQTAGQCEAACARCRSRQRSSAHGLPDRRASGRHHDRSEPAKMPSGPGGPRSDRVLRHQDVPAVDP